MENDKKKRQTKGSFYCKALFIQTWSPSAQQRYTTALAASAFVQAEKSPQIFPAIKYCLGKTNRQSSCIPEISLRLWIIILGRSEVKAAEIFFPPSLFHSFIFFAQQLWFQEKPSSEWHWITCSSLRFLVGPTWVYCRTKWWSHLTASLPPQAVILCWWMSGNRGCPALPCHRPFSRSCAVSLPEDALVTLSNPTPTERPSEGLSWLPLPGPQRPVSHRPDLCHLLPQHTARASDGTQPAVLGWLPRSGWGPGWRQVRFNGRLWCRWPEYAVAVGPEGACRSPGPHSPR